MNPLHVVAEKIARCANRSDDLALTAAMLACEARIRVEKGEAGHGVTWEKWAKENIGLSPSRLRELLQIGKAADPKAKLEEIRGQIKKRVARHRKKRPSAPLRNGGGLEDERKELISWAKSAPLPEVRRILTMVKEPEVEDLLELPECLDRRRKSASVADIGHAEARP